MIYLNVMEIVGIAWLIIPMDVEIKHGGFLFHSWNLFVAICAIPRCVCVCHRNLSPSHRIRTKDFLPFSSLMLGLWLFFFPESPKFLIECGETEEALDILRDMYEENTGRDRSEYPVGLKHLMIRNDNELNQNTIFCSFGRSKV